MANPSLDLEKTIETLMQKRGVDLEIAIENLRKDSLLTQASALKQKLITDGRCPICTLKTPCKHSHSPNQCKPFKEHPVTLSPVLHSSPHSSNSMNNSISPNMSSFKVRYRGKKVDSPVSTQKIDEFEKLKLMEKLEKYKEEKLRREIQHIEEIKKLEEIEAEREKQLEKRRDIYYGRQKEKLKWYKEDLKHKIEEMERKRISLEVQEKMMNNQQRRLHEEKKQRIYEYHLKRLVKDDEKEIHSTGINETQPVKKIKRKYKFKSTKVL